MADPTQQRSATDERDELALELYICDNWRQPRQTSIQDWVWFRVAGKAQGQVEHYKDMAAHLIAAGYRKPQQVTTVEELDALPGAVLILTEQGGYWESIKRMDGKNWWKEPGARKVSPSDDLTLPATILNCG